MKLNVGYVSLAFTMMAATIISFLGDYIIGWVLYVIASITGIIHNHSEKNRSMTATFVFFLIMNIVAIIRILITRGI
jgi:hypothetical protein